LIETIQYEERREIEDVDKQTSVSVYDFILHDKEVEIAVGKRKYKGTGEKMVAYFPIYLMSGDKVKSQIGVFELLPKYELDPTYMDENNELNLSNLEFLDDDNNLKLNLYGFVNKRFLSKYEKPEPVSEVVSKDLSKTASKDLDEDLTEAKGKDLSKAASKDLSEAEDVINSDDPTELHFNPEAKHDIPEKYTTIFETDASHPGQEPLPEETKADDEKMKADYSPSHSDQWIKKFMRRAEFRIVDVEANGDCFFAVIREAFARIGHKTSTKRLREVVADEVGDDQLESYKSMYFAFVGELADIENKMRDHVKTNAEQKKRIAKSVSKEDKKQLLGGAKANVDEYRRLAEDKKLLESDLQKYRFMKGVDTLEDFKSAIKTQSYWADEMAISILEKKLNIKMIILSEESYKARDENAVMKCISGYTSEGDAITNPDYYIMASHTGDHYQLITYKNAGIFRFSEIPYSIKILIVNKCIERNSGSFQYISKFRDFQRKLGVKLLEEDYLKEDSDLYNGDNVFQFYNRSNPKPAPGKGSGEKIQEKDVKAFIDLRKNVGWRQMLDDEYNTTFHLKNKRWSSVEHYFQASKFEKHRPLYESFTLDSDSEVSKDVAKAKKEAKKEEGTKLEPHFFEGRHKAARKEAIMAKFDQNEELRRVLLNTKNAKLVYYEQGKEAEPDTILMEVRAELLKQLSA
jgi:predicted NAD-dependent protein-ADP-ribosyltransferase YbiA (DUF1768 family)